MRAITRRGLTACSTSGPSPSRSSCPARRFSTSTSARAASCSTVSRSRFRSSTTDSLLRPCMLNHTELPVHRRAPAAERIAARRLDLDHLGAEIGQDAGAERRRDVMADFQHLQAGQRAGSLRRNRASGAPVACNREDNKRRIRASDTPALPFHKRFTAILLHGAGFGRCPVSSPMSRR